MQDVSQLCPVVVSGDSVYTGFQPVRRVEALALFGGRVVYAGAAVEATRVAEALASLLNCRPQAYRFEGVVVPGFVDAHLHLAALGFESRGLDLRSVRSIEELKRLVSAAASTSGGWVYGRGWDQEEMRAWPTRYDLDEAAPGHPVLLMRRCGHVAVASTRALELLGLDSGVEGVDVGCDGSPTGLLFENAAWRAYREVRRLAGDPLRDILAAQERLLGYGVTAVGAMDVSGWEAAGLLEAWRRGLLALRVRAYLSWDFFSRLLDAGLKGPLGGETLVFGGVKLYADGSLGARTALLREPYSDQPGTRGVQLLSPGQLAWRIRLAARHGFDTAVHAIGDGAVENTVVAYAAAGYPGRVEHFSVAPRELVEAAAGLGLRAVVQPAFLGSDWWAVERLGPRARSLYPFRTMISTSLAVGFSSDAPVEEPNPLEAVYYAATRGSLADYTWEERLSVAEALHLHTLGAARALRLHDAGCLEQGCLADIAVLDRDPLGEPVDELPSIRVEAVMVGGRLVWRRGRRSVGA